MPTIRYTTSVASAEHSVVAGDERKVSPSEAKQAVADGVAELVTSRTPSTPERAVTEHGGGPELRGS